MLRRVRRLLGLVAGLAMVLAWSRPAAAGEKLTAEALVALHREALGAAPAAAQGRRVLLGSCRMEIRRGGAANIEGKARFSSEGRQLRVDLTFDQSAYWGERFGFDGERVDVGFIQPVRRSPLGHFLNTYQVILKEGLLGGVLSTAWPLLDLDSRRPKLKYDGIKKVAGRPVHQLRYQMAKGQDEMTITMAFEAETFLHVGTVYALRLMPGLTSDIQNSASQVDVLLRLEESFSNFVAVDGLKLPRRWTLTYETGGGASDTFWMWESVFESVAQ